MLQLRIIVSFPNGYRAAVFFDYGVTLLISSISIQTSLNVTVQLLLVKLFMMIQSQIIAIEMIFMSDLYDGFIYLPI